MSSGLFIFLICAAILAILIARAIYVVRMEADETARGAEPGKGDLTIHADYSSGFSGHSTSYKIPRDPQAYARRFVPLRSRDDDHE
ncbi:MAG: hypothetical protein AAF841_06680 [Pseudomonadota bacterium]